MIPNTYLSRQPMVYDGSTAAHVFAGTPLEEDRVADFLVEFPFGHMV